MDWTYRLRLRHLEILLSIAQTGNLSQSAQALHTTQPALSKWLKELEADIGLPLFERHARGLRPTPYGQALLGHAQRIAGHLDSAREDMRALLDGGSGRVVIGTSGVSATGVVPLAVARLIEQLPRAQASLMESAMDQLIPRLLQGELDIVVGRTMPANALLAGRELRTEMLYSDPVNFVAGLQHPLAAHKTVAWDDLLAYPWIIWPQGTPIRNAIDTALAAAGRGLPRHCVETNSSLLNLTLLAHSDLIGVASHRAARHFASLKLLCILPMTLDSLGQVSMYWLADENRRAVTLALDCLRAAAGERGSTQAAARAKPGAQRLRRKSHQRSSTQQDGI
ncbi:MAG: LysR family transcriptional regulator [Burkholderiaceae bacterium]|jgi:DNA-binding transcriptional LysR family regulator|nr:LysR family transcriptional regulator [Burkholderiaceae bacterium]